MWILIIIFFLIAIISLIKYFTLKEKSQIAPEGKSDYFQNQAQPGQNFAQGAFTEAQLKRDKNIQDSANAATDSAIIGLRQTSDAELAQLEKGANKPRHEEKREVEKAETQTVLTQHQTAQKQLQLTERLIDIAMALDIDVDTYLIQQRNRLDIEKLEQETMVKLKAGFVYKLGNYQELTMLRDQLDQLYEKRQLVLQSKAAKAVKKDKLTQIALDIVALEQVTNERRQGLLQADNGQDAGGSD